MASNGFIEALQLRTDDSFRVLVEAVTDYAIFLLTPSGQVASWNAGAQRLKGYAADEIIGQHFSRFYTAADRQAGLPERLLRDAQAVGLAENIGWRVRSDGTLFWADVIITALRDEAGGPCGYAKVTRDITDRHVLEQEQERESRYRADLMRVQVEIASADLNPASLTRLVAERVKALTAADDASVVLRRDIVAGSLADECVAAGRVCGSSDAEAGSIVIAPVAHHGRTLGVLTIAARAADAFDARAVDAAQILGGLLGVALAHAEALEERRFAETAARTAADYVSSVLRAATNSCILGTDLHGLITVFNSGAERMLGYSAHEVIGRQNVLTFVAPEDLAQRAAELGTPVGLEAITWSAMRGETETRDWTVVRSDGSRLIASATVTGIRDQQGELVGFVGVAIDVTEQRAIEQIKNDLISVVSHELRTPLTVLRGSLGLLAAGAMVDVQQSQRMLEMAHANTERLARLVDDIVDMDRLQAGQGVTAVDDCDLRELMALAVDELRPAADRAQVRVEVRAEEPVHVRGDTERLLQMLGILLGNAIKFSFANGQVDLVLERDSRSAQIRVRDRGQGIPAEQLSRVFERFQLADASDARQKGGTGLGLAICRAIVLQHGGRIWAESAVSRGSTFFVELPLG